jgi:ABC-type transporter Mla subunit MlaD
VEDWEDPNQSITQPDRRDPAVAIADRLNALTAKAKQTAAEHKDDLHRAAEKTSTLADKQTRGKYHDKIQKAATKVDALIEKIPDQPNDQPGEGEPTKGPDSE